MKRLVLFLAILSIAVMSITLAILVNFSLTYTVKKGVRPDGSLDWEQHERHSWNGKVILAKTIRYHANGSISMLFDGRSTRFWNRNGSEVSDREWFAESFVDIADIDIVTEKPYTWGFWELIYSRPN